MPTTYHLTDFSQLQDVYDAISEDFDSVDYADWLNDELVRMADLHKTFFASQTDPGGAAWKPNAPATIKAKGHKRILRGHPKNNYRLSRSLTQKSRTSTGDAIREGINEQDGRAMLRFGTDVPYSVYNENRRHVGINEQHLQGMVERVADHVVQQLAK
jgi:hypothetical protein